MLELSRKLATIDTARAARGERRTTSRAAQPDPARLRELYTRLELRALLRSLDGPPEPSPPPAPAADPPRRRRRRRAAQRRRRRPPIGDRAYEMSSRRRRFDAWLAKLAAAPLISFDTETDSLDYMRARIVGRLVRRLRPEKPPTCPCRTIIPAPRRSSRANACSPQLKPLLEDAARPKLGHHLKFDCHILANYGIALAGQSYDSMLESYVLNSVATRHDMDSAVAKYLGMETIHFEDVCGKGAKQITFNQVDVDSRDANTPRRTRTSLSGCTGRCGRRSRRYRS